MTATEMVLPYPPEPALRAMPILEPVAEVFAAQPAGELVNVLTGGLVAVRPLRQAAARRLLHRWPRAWSSNNRRGETASCALSPELSAQANHAAA